MEHFVVLPVQSKTLKETSAQFIHDIQKTLYASIMNDNNPTSG